jgi:plastocyanin domain-containing protein
MAIDKLLVTIIGALGMAFIYWFFLMKKERVVTALDSIDIVVDGGYTPEAISIPNNKQTTLHFIRKDQNPCLEEVIISEFKVRKYLPLNERVSVTLLPKRTGDFLFSCGMNMFHGKLIVR